MKRSLARQLLSPRPKFARIPPRVATLNFVATSRSARARERGTTLLESAVMISLLLLMMFGIIGFGTALYTYHFVSNTAREATRWASVRGSTCTGGLSGGCPAADTDVNAYVQNLSTGIGLDPTKVTTTTTWVAPPNNLAACAIHPIVPAVWSKSRCNTHSSFCFRFCPRVLRCKALHRWSSRNSNSDLISFRGIVWRKACRPLHRGRKLANRYEPARSASLHRTVHGLTYQRSERTFNNLPSFSPNCRILIAGVLKS